MTRARTGCVTYKLLGETKESTTFLHHGDQTRKKERKQIDRSMVDTCEGIEDVGIKCGLETIFDISSNHARANTRSPKAVLLIIKQHSNLESIYVESKCIRGARVNGY